MNRFAFAFGLVVAATAWPALAVNPTGLASEPTTGKSVSYKSLMTPLERNTFRNKVRSSASPEECSAYIQDWNTKLEARAKEKGVTDVKMPPAEMCERKRKPESADAGQKGEKTAKPAPAGAAAPAAPATK
jgi:hypothetical protein